MKKIFPIFLILAFAIPYAAFSQTYFGFTGGGSGGGGANVDPGTTVGDMLVWQGIKWVPGTGISWDDVVNQLSVESIRVQGTTNPQIELYTDATNGIDGYINPTGNLTLTFQGTATGVGFGTYVSGTRVTIGTDATNTGLYVFGPGPFVDGARTATIFAGSNSGATTGIALQNTGASALNTRTQIAMMANTDSPTLASFGRITTTVLDNIAASYSGSVNIMVASGGSLETGIVVDGDTDTVSIGDGWLFEIPNGLEKTTLKTDANGHFFGWPTGDNVHWGIFSGQLYAGSGSVGYGQYTIFNATGNSITAVGSFAAQSSAGSGVTAIGNSAGYQNNADGLAAVGELAARNNLGTSTSAFGDQAAYLNTGSLGTFMSTRSGRQNTGVCSTGVGNNALEFNDSDYAGAIGCDAWSSFIPNLAGNKTFAFSDINIATDRVTVTGHGFGSNNAYKNLLYTEGTGPITGLASGTVYQIRIIDSNTIGFNELVGPGGIARGTNITAAGSGTGHTLTPQNEFDNTIVIGNNGVPTLADSIILAGDHEHIVIGAGAANIDYDVTFDGETNDGKFTWKEDEAILEFDSTIDVKSMNISSVISPPTITADLDDWNPTGLSACRVIEVVTDGSNHDITGIQSIASRVIVIQNIGSGIGTANVILKHDDVGSLAANRMLLPGGADVTLQRYKSVTLRYADSQSRWMVLSEQP